MHTQTIRHMAEFTETLTITRTHILFLKLCVSFLFFFGVGDVNTMNSLNITDPVVKTRGMHYETSDLFFGEARPLEQTDTNRTYTCYTEVYTLTSM